jgi:hypothetical protein
MAGENRGDDASAQLRSFWRLAVLLLHLHQVPPMRPQSYPDEKGSKEEKLQSTFNRACLTLEIARTIHPSTFTRHSPF